MNFTHPAKRGTNQLRRQTMNLEDDVNLGTFQVGCMAHGDSKLQIGPQRASWSLFQFYLRYMNVDSDMEILLLLLLLLLLLRVLLFL
jgi:hypothetical protein